MKIFFLFISVFFIAACQTNVESGATSQRSSPIPLLAGNADPLDIPQDYFAGYGTQWFVNVHNWRNGLGKTRYFEPTSGDLSRYRATDARVMRLQLNFDGAVFWRECNWRLDGDYDGRNACYDAAYSKARKDSWAIQIADLNNVSENPVIRMYVSGAKRLNDAGFHVILAPSDFFWGNGGNWTSSTSDPLMHQYLERDLNFQNYYVAWSNRLVAAMVAGGVTSFSLQSANEPRFCDSGVRKWQALERRIFDAARTAAPGLHVVSTAVCTAGDQVLSRSRNYSGLASLLPSHSLENISYSIHMRNPRLLHVADHKKFVPGTVLHYPYQPLSTSAGLDDATVDEIRRYNSIKPDAALYRNLFSQVSALAQRRGARIIVTEWSVSKPDYGLPRAERIRLFHDVITASRASNISIIYNGLLGRDGLASGPDSIGTPDHNFDPQLLREFAIANGR